MSQRQTLPNTKILIVDDSPQVRETLRTHLSSESLGAEVDEAPNGAAGLQKALKEDYDCVICDLEMPVMGGIAFLRMVRAKKNRMELPVLLLTSADTVTQKVEGFQNGASDFVSKPFAPEELLARVETHVSLARMHRQLTHAANADPLTGLANRRKFMESLNAEFDRAKRLDRQVSLLLLDVDHFKGINDSYGHPTGDAVLISLGKLLAKSHRYYDQVGRLGGEEFAILLPEVTPENAWMVAERVRADVEANAHGELPQGRVTVSIGMAVFPDEGVEDPSDFYKAADEQLYNAKEGGRNRVACGRSCETMRKTA